MGNRNAGGSGAVEGVAAAAVPPPTPSPGPAPPGPSDGSFAGVARRSCSPREIAVSSSRSWDRSSSSVSRSSASWDIACPCNRTRSSAAPIRSRAASRSASTTAHSLTSSRCRSSRSSSSTCWWTSAIAARSVVTHAEVSPIAEIHVSTPPSRSCGEPFHAPSWMREPAITGGAVADGSAKRPPPSSVTERRSCTAARIVSSSHSADVLRRRSRRCVTTSCTTSATSAVLTVPIEARPSSSPAPTRRGCRSASTIASSRGSGASATSDWISRSICSMRVTAESSLEDRSSSARTDGMPITYEL